MSAPDFSGFTYSGPQAPPAPDPNQPDFSQFGPPVTSSMGSFPSGAAPATLTSPPPAGTADLENQVGPAQQALLQGLQTQQAQPQGQPGQLQQPQFQDPLGPMLNDLVQKHQQLMAAQQPPSPGSPVKNLLRNFFQGAGNAMMRDAGLPTPDMQRQQLETQITNLSNARSLYMDRQAEAASRQMQLQIMSQQMQPASPELASAIGTPQLAGTVIPPAYLPVISNENRGREAAQIAAQQRQDQLDQNKITLPPTVITKAAATAAGYPELEGKTLTTAQDYATFEKLSQARGLQKFDTGRDGQGQGHGIWILDKVGNPVQQISAISETNRATKLATAGMGQVYALPPGATNPVLTTMGAAQANGMQIVRPATAADNEKAINAHDKAYVQPAEQVEKSYQMMNQAYNEYQGAAAQGKDLPTGAQSMVALSTHLATTFGNVKGSRITKDMIQEHLGARSISDAALVATQKLTNGDVLSPAQWSAFHDLISNSRRLSWQIAATEAQRKAIPTNFLPPDLNRLGSGIASPNQNNGSNSGGFNWDAIPRRGQ